jgi:hypothetical protein
VVAKAGSASEQHRSKSAGAYLKWFIDFLATPDHNSATLTPLTEHFNRDLLFGSKT